MKKIALSKRGKNKGKYVALVDDNLFDELNQFNWYAQKGDKTFYACRWIRVSSGKQQLISMHNDVFRLLGIIGQPDHKNQDGLDNRIENLRPATPSQQKCNQSKYANNTSGFRGVSFAKHTNKFRAIAQFNGTRKHLGYFDNPVQAAIVRDEYVKQHHGDFAVLNFPGRPKRRAA